MDNHGQTRIDLTSQDGNINELIVRARTRALSLGTRQSDIVIKITYNQYHELREHINRIGANSLPMNTSNLTYQGVMLEVVPSTVRPIVDEWETVSGTGGTLRLPGMVNGTVMRWVDSITPTGYSRTPQLNEEGLKVQLVGQDSDTLDRLVDFINNTIRDRVDAQRRQA